MEDENIANDNIENSQDIQQNRKKKRRKKSKPKIISDEETNTPETNSTEPQIQPFVITDDQIRYHEKVKKIIYIILFFYFIHVC